MKSAKTIWCGFALLGAALWAQTNVAPVPAQTNVAPVSGLTLGATNEPTTITCQRWKFEYARNIVFFQGDVLAVNPRATVRSDFMFVTLDQARSISNIVADGQVVIVTPNNEKATGGHAEYTVTTHKLVLTQDPKVNARGTLWTGERITFLIQSNGIQDVEVESGPTKPSRLIITPDAQKKKEPEKKTEPKKKPTP
jgi:lipopolysaccharide transport protein LptA